MFIIFYERGRENSASSKIKARDTCILFKVLHVTSVITKGSCLWGMKMEWRGRL